MERERERKSFLLSPLFTSAHSVNAQHTNCFDANVFYTDTCLHLNHSFSVTGCISILEREKKRVKRVRRTRNQKVNPFENLTIEKVSERERHQRLVLGITGAFLVRI